MSLLQVTSVGSSPGIPLLVMALLLTVYGVNTIMYRPPWHRRLGVARLQLPRYTTLVTSSR